MFPNLQALLEQMELLKAIKLDREDMVEALADKADLRMLARKVSHDQFEMACEDLSSGLEHAIDKLHVQVPNKHDFTSISHQN